MRGCGSMSQYGMCNLCCAGRYCSYDVALRRLRVTIVAMEEQYYFLWLWFWPKLFRMEAHAPCFIVISVLFKTFLARLQNCEKLLLASLCLPVRPHGATRLPLDGLSWSLNISRKSVKKIQLSLKCDKNNRYFTSRPIYICGQISLISYWNEQDRHYTYIVTMRLIRSIVVAVQNQYHIL